ncbi:MAG: gliding motility protein GldM [Chitinophagaceae bacterium]|nr:MAG: gliding motility protein GldM [Chitinophagaceae bacterium]
MALPKDPRQLMINLMYLVLTAMLALNITKEVLNAFQTINHSIEGSNASIDAKNESIYKAFDAAEAKADTRDRAKPWNDKAKLVKAETDKITAYLGAWKDSVIARSGGYIDNNGVKELKSMEDIDAATRLFVEEKKGDDIRSKLEGYVNFLVGKFDNQAEKDQMKSLMPIQIKDPLRSEDNPTGSWTYGTFHNIPVVAAIAMFSKFQNDVKNAEAVALNSMFKHIDDEVIAFDDMVAIAVPKTSYALEGQDMEANVMLVAYNKAYNPNMSVPGIPVKVENGIGTMKFKASGAGIKTVNGVISRQVRGENKSYPFKFEYMVGSAGASLQLDKMNVMYIGVDNPMTLSASGYNIEDVSLSLPGAELRGGTGKGTYIAKVTKEGTLDWSINAKGRTGGGVSKIGGGKIRVKSIPNPVATILNKSSGTIPIAQFKVQTGILAKVENFDFETMFKVTKFRFTWIPKVGADPYEKEVVGAYFTSEVKNVYPRMRPGDIVIMTNIKAIGPDGRERSINSITFTLN